jgi:hypothetical protein
VGLSLLSAVAGHNETLALVCDIAKRFRSPATFRRVLSALHRDGMGGKFNRTTRQQQPSTRGQDATGRWYEECRNLEDRLGYGYEELFREWKQLALMREAESVAKLPRDVCEEMAFLMMLEARDRQGCGPETAN